MSFDKPTPIGVYRLWLDQPLEISLETFAFCNAACTFCPYVDLDRKGEKLPDELIARLVDEMATFKRQFWFSPFKVNEPLLDKRVLPLMRTMNERVPLAGLRLFTNGTGMTDDNIEGILGLKNYEVNVSLNSHEKSEYETLMGLKFDKTVARIDAVHKTSMQNVTLTRVGSSEGFLEYCRDRWPKFKAFQLKRDAWLGYTNGDLTEVPDKLCLRWWELSIMANGLVSLCCMDGEGKYPIGDIRKQTLLEVYNAPGYRERRVRLLSRKKVSPCDQCTY